MINQQTIINAECLLSYLHYVRKLFYYKNKSKFTFFMFFNTIEKQ